LVKYLEPLYAETELASWAAEKFGVKVDPKEMLIDVERQMRKPVDEIRSMPVRRLRDRLIGFQEQYLEDGRLDKEINQILSAGEELSVIAKAMNERFGTHLAADDLQDHQPKAAVVDRKGFKPEPAAQPLSLREKLVHFGRDFFRKELTDLEQFVMIQIFDQSWKDHLYAMDMLRNGIGLQAFAEKDPRIQYKKEGYKYFAEMMEGIRDKVTDLIFRARIVGNVQARNAYQVTAATHEETSGYGVGENVKELAAATATAGGEAEGGEVDNRIVKPIVRESPKVGRNDPCPCGSGRKYKKCHGANAA